MRLVDPDVLDDHKYYCDWEAIPAPLPCPRLARVRRAYEAGEYLPAVAQELGITKNAVIGLAQRAGLRHRFPRLRVQYKKNLLVGQNNA